jgi:hypothetical protein
MNNRNANPELLAHWMQAWTTLGRWQALNARLSKEAAPLTTGWAHHCSPSFGKHAVAGASAARPGSAW